MVKKSKNVQKIDIKEVTGPLGEKPHEETPISRQIKYVLSFRWLGIRAVVGRTEVTSFDRRPRNDER